MKRRELEALVNRLKHTAIGVADSTLEEERQDAADFYYGRNWRPAPEGRSQFVDRTLMDTVEWAMPQIMGVFASTDEIVRFEPQGAEDEDLAEQETAYVNHTLMRKENGFLTLHDAVKDALIFRNGYIKCSWDTKTRTSIETYANLTEDGLAKLLADYEEEGATVEVIEQEESSVLTEQGEIPAVNVKLRVTTDEGYLCSEAVPPEEILVSEDAKGSISELPFVGHLTTKRRTDLIEMGLPRDFVDNLPTYYIDDEDSTGGRRDPIIEDDPEEALDRSMEPVEYLEAYVRVDYNDDGKAELRKVVSVGGKIPPGEEWLEEIDCIPIVYGVPLRMPHRHIGVSMYDLLRDLQEIRSTLYRQLLDNVYLTNNQRPVISDKVKLTDLAVYKPGSPIRVDTDMADVQGHIQWAAPTPIVQQLIPVLDLMDNVKEQRTGIGRNNTNIDPDVLTNAPDALVARAQSAANAKVEMIVRLLAETLVKDWVRLAHKMLIKYSDRASVFKLRGEYVPIDPREWKERDDLSVSVGLGTGTEEEKQQKLAALAAVMEKAAQVGIVSPENVFNYAEDATKALGFKLATRYFQDPGTPEFQQMQQRRQQAQQQQAQQQMQQQAQMLALTEQIKGEYKNAGDQLKARTDMSKAQMDNVQKMRELVHEDRQQMRELAFKLKELISKGEIDIAKMEVDAFIEGANADVGEPGMGGELKDGIG